MGCTVDWYLDCTWLCTVCTLDGTPWTVYCTVHWDVPLVCTSVCPAVHRFAPNVSRCALGLCQMCSRCSGCAPAVHLDCTPNVLQLCSGPHTKCTPAVFQLCSRCISCALHVSSCVQKCPDVLRVCTELYTVHWTVHYTMHWTADWTEHYIVHWTVKN